MNPTPALLRSINRFNSYQLPLPKLSRTHTPATASERCAVRCWSNHESTADSDRQLPLSTQQSPCRPSQPLLTAQCIISHHPLQLSLHSIQCFASRLPSYRLNRPSVFSSMFCPLTSVSAARRPRPAAICSSQLAFPLPCLCWSPAVGRPLQRVQVSSVVLSASKQRTASASLSCSVRTSHEDCLHCTALDKARDDVKAHLSADS